MSEWKHPEIGDTVNGWLVIACESAYPDDKWVAIMMDENGPRSPYCVATFRENRDWSRPMRVEVFSDFTTAIGEYSKRRS